MPRVILFIEKARVLLLLGYSSYSSYSRIEPGTFYIIGFMQMRKISCSSDYFFVIGIFALEQALTSDKWLFIPKLDALF